MKITIAISMAMAKINKKTQIVHDFKNESHKFTAETLKQFIVVLTIVIAIDF